tara:strand:- start:386 stop:739 length:354 start_codon:yes stop_codon:yes gene_type:complete
MNTQEVFDDGDQQLSDYNDHLQMEYSPKQGGKMAYDNTPRDNSVTIWLNEGPKKSEKSPDFGGKGLINGKEMRVSGWRNVTQDGRKKINLRFEVPDSFKSGAAPKPDKKEEPADDWF